MENRYVPIEELIARVKDVDIILTEGYKHGPWPKIALQRSANEKPLPLLPEDCLAIMTDAPLVTDTVCLGLNDVIKLADIILADMNKRL
jgi:molybdopterin-guanine dinucleotide biosynthesis protein MobB